MRSTNLMQLFLTTFLKGVRLAIHGEKRLPPRSIVPLRIAEHLSNLEILFARLFRTEFSVLHLLHISKIDMIREVTNT